MLQFVTPDNDIVGQMLRIFADFTKIDVSNGKSFCREKSPEFKGTIEEYQYGE
jgi:hypothetical protein